MATRKINDEQIKEVMERVKRGETIPALSREYGYAAPSSLYGLLARHCDYIPTGEYESTIQVPDNPIELGYLAGIIDGEGSIMLAEGKYWHVKVGMTDFEVINWLESLGGKTNHGYPTPPRKPTKIWFVARKKDVGTLLKAILPYLKVPSKIEKATLAIEYSNTPRKKRIKWGPSPQN
jgi:hypothetical protein